MNIPAALDALETFLGQRLSRSKSDLTLHGGSETHFPQMPPDAVAYPETTADVSGIMQICAKHGCPVIAWGVGTSLEGHVSAVKGGVTMDMGRMNRVLDIQAADMDVRVQPGVTREALNAELRATGLFFPIDPGANATLGGMAATRASGTTTVRYGTMRDNAFYAILALRPGMRSMVTDICVPISRLAQAVEETRADIAKSGLVGPILGHVGDGNFHAILLVDSDQPSEMTTAKAVSHRMVERALALGGTASGEHGVGLGKRDYMELEHSDGWAVMGQLKQALDPADLLNPGKLVP